MQKAEIWDAPSERGGDLARAECQPVPVSTERLTGSPAHYESAAVLQLVGDDLMLRYILHSARYLLPRKTSPISFLLGNSFYFGIPESFPLNRRASTLDLVNNFFECRWYDPVWRPEAAAWSTAPIKSIL